MIDKKFLKVTKTKLKERLERDILGFICNITDRITDDIMSRKEKKIELVELVGYADFVSLFINSFVYDEYVPIEKFGRGIQICFMVISEMVEKCEMTAEEKKCIIFDFIDSSIKNGILESSSIIPKDIGLQYFMINEYFFKKIRNGDKVSFEDLFDLRVALMNLCVNTNVINDLFIAIKKELNISSALEAKDDSKLCPSMKKLNDQVLLYSNKFIDGDIDDPIVSKVFSYRKKYMVRNSLYLLSTIINAEYVFTDFKLFSDVLVGFKSEFELNNFDFINIIFGIIERNINLGILEEGHVVFPVSKIPRELIAGESKFFIEVDADFIDNLSEFPNLSDSIIKFSSFIKNEYTVLLDSYFNKKQSDGSLEDFHESDLNKIEGVLKKIGVNDFVINCIVKTLKTKVINSAITIFDKSEKEKLSDVEYKEYLRILKTYIQFDEKLPNDEMIINNMEVLKKVTVKDKRICVSLMEKLGFSDKVILSFLEKVERVNLFSMDIKTIIASYEMEVKNWLNVYREYDEYRERVNNIEEVYKEVCSCYINYYKNKDSSSYKECEEWCKILKSEIEEFYLVIDSIKVRNSSLLKKIRSRKEDK